MNRIRIVPRADLGEWDHAIMDSDASCMLFRSSYMNYHADRFTDASLLAVLSNGRLAAFPATRNGDKVISHGGLTFGGLQLPKNATFEDERNVIQLIADYYRPLGIRSLVIKETPSCFLSDSRPLCAGLKLMHSVEYDGAAVDLRKPLEVSPKRRPTRIQRALINHVIGEEPVSSFWPLLEAVLAERHDVRPVHSKHEMESLMSRSEGRIRIFGARHKGLLRAGAILYQSRHAVHVQYMATDEEGRHVHSLDALLFWLMKTYKTEVSWFSLGISNERDGSLNRGLFDYKMSFGAVRIAHVTNEYALS